MARNTNGKGFSLKDHLFNREKVEYLADLFVSSESSFKKDKFVTEVMQDLQKLELKARIVLITEVLEKHLPKDFEKATGIIVKALPSALDSKKTDDDFGDFIFAPLGEFVVRNGLCKKHLKTSLKTLKEITQRFSMEDAIRYFLNAFEDQTMKELEKWVKHTHYHVRRLVSEGTRPFLPWSGRISLEVTKPIHFLDQLYHDDTRFVTRSVSNHMNDIAKIEPKLVVGTLKKWKREGKQEKKEMDWIISHSLRTLVKQGNKQALELLGYHASPKIEVDRFALSKSSKQIAPGGTLSFSFDIIAEKDEKLMIDYVIDFVKANGKTKSKVFKLSKKSIKKGEILFFEKNHKLLADATTFTLYPGKHTVTLQINGKKFNSNFFEIK